MRRLAGLDPRIGDATLAVLGRRGGGLDGPPNVSQQATVKTHVGRILPKLGLRDRAQAVVFAYEIGLVTPGA